MNPSRRAFIVVLSALTTISVVGLLVTPASAGVGPNPPGSTDPSIQPEDLTPRLPEYVPEAQLLDAEVVEGDPGDANVLAFELVTTTPRDWNRTFELYAFWGTATKGVDYLPPPSNVLLPAGETSVVIEVEVIGDLLPEGDETMWLTAQESASVHQFSAKGTILNDDPHVSYSLADAQTYEGGGAVRGTNFLSFELTASEALDHDVTFLAVTQSGTALPGEDYVAQSYVPVVLHAGTTSLQVLVEVVGDTLVENNESMVLQLYRLDHANVWHVIQATGTILDDDSKRASSVRA